MVCSPRSPYEKLFINNRAAANSSLALWRLILTHSSIVLASSRGEATSGLLRACDNTFSRSACRRFPTARLMTLIFLFISSLITHESLPCVVTMKNSAHEGITRSNTSALQLLGEVESYTFEVIKKPTVAGCVIFSIQTH